MSKHPIRRSPSLSQRPSPARSALTAACLSPPSGGRRTLRGRPVRPREPRVRGRPLRPRQRRRLRLPLPLRGGRGRQRVADPADHRLAEGALRADLLVGAGRRPDRGGRRRGAAAQRRRPPGEALLPRRPTAPRSGRLATGRDAATGFESFSRDLGDGGRAGFAATLACEDGSGCPAQRPGEGLGPLGPSDDRRSAAARPRSRADRSARPAGTAAPARSAPSPPTAAPASAGSRSPSTASPSRRRERFPAR